MKKKKYLMDDFEFESEDMYVRTKAEQNGIQYIEEMLDMDDADPDNIEKTAKIYASILENQVFVTPIGISYLGKVRRYLVSSGFPEEKLAYVPIPDTAESIRIVYTPKERLQHRLFWSRIINVILLILIILILIICTNSKNLNILNYKNRLDRQYNNKTTSSVMPSDNN